MASNPTEKSKYPSRYSPDAWVTPAQYIVELVCEQAAKHTNRDLPLRFWKDPEWEKFFKSQTRRSNALLKKYEAKAIINTIKKKRLRSLMAKWVEDVIQKEQNVINASKSVDRQEPKKKTPGIINKAPVGRRGMTKNSPLDKLLALDEAIENGEEETCG